MKKLLLITTLILANISFAQAPTNGLVAYYGFNNNYNSHNGLYNLTNLHTTGSIVTFNPGVVGNGATFDGTKALQTTAMGTQINNEFSIAFWQKSPGIQGQIYATRFELFGSVFHRNEGAAGNLSRAKISIANNSWVGPNMDVVQNANSWQHIVISYHSSGFFNVWVNGVYDATLSQNVGYANLIKYNQIFSIGGGATTAGAFLASKGFVGTIDEVYVYNRGLSSAEINQVKNDTAGVLPSVFISSDALFENTSAEITTVIDSNNLSSTVTLNWGNASNALTNSVALGTIPSGNGIVTIANTLSGLTNGNTYYYQVTITNSNGTSTSTIYSFTNSKVLAFRFNATPYSEDGLIFLGAPSGTYPGYVPDRAGNANSAVFLRNYEALVSGNIPILPQGSAKRSVSFWFKRDRTLSEIQRVFQWGTQTTGNAYGGTINSDNTVTNFGWSADVTSQTATALTTSWDHYVFTYGDNGLVSIYKNGVLIRTGNQNWNTIGNVLKLGSQTASSVDNVYGHLDDFEVYNTALTATQVSNLFNTGSGLLATQNFNSNNLKATIYPNPTTDNFSIEMGNEVKSVEIYSLQGQKVLTSDAKDINVSNLSKGIYLVRIEDVNNAISTQKLIIK